MFRGGRAAEACALVLPPLRKGGHLTAAAEGEGGGEGKGNAAQRSSFGDVEALAALAVRYREVRALSHALLAAGAAQRPPTSTAAAAAGTQLAAACGFLANRRCHLALYRLALLRADYRLACAASLQLFAGSGTPEAAAAHLSNAQLHCADALQQLAAAQPLRAAQSLRAAHSPRATSAAAAAVAAAAVNAAAGSRAPAAPLPPLPPLPLALAWACTAGCQALRQLSLEIRLQAEVAAALLSTGGITSSAAAARMTLSKPLLPSEDADAAADESGAAAAADWEPPSSLANSISADLSAALSGTLLPADVALLACCMPPPAAALPAERRGRVAALLLLLRPGQATSAFSAVSAAASAATAAASGSAGEAPEPAPEGFDLAFRVITMFELDACAVYCAAADVMARPIHTPFLPAARETRTP